MAAARKGAWVLACVLAWVLAWFDTVRTPRSSHLAVLLAQPLASWLQHARVQRQAVGASPTRPQIEVRWGLQPVYSHTLSVRQTFHPSRQFD